MNAAPSLLVNQIKSANHWIAIRTVGTKSNRDGIGARIRLKTATRILVDEVRSGSSYISNSDMRVHFGLGKTDKIEWVEVRWPSGTARALFKSGSGSDSHAQRRVTAHRAEAGAEESAVILLARSLPFLENCMVRAIPSPSFT